MRTTEAAGSTDNDDRKPVDHGPGTRALFQAIAIVLLISAPTDVSATDDILGRPAPGQVEELSSSSPSEPIDRQFQAAAPELPFIAPRTIYYDKANRLALTEEEAAAKTEAELAGFERLVLDDRFYYFTKYGSPLAYSRPLAILNEAGFRVIERKRILDFGFGSIGHLRLMACIGGRVTGIEVDPMLRALYSRPEDTGIIPKSALARSRYDGTLDLVFGSFPGDSATAAAVGDGYDLILSKNTLKRGYIHPDREADPRQLVHLGVDDSTFVAEIFQRLKPGGFFMIYNLHPGLSRADEPYKPWADGRCPFDKKLLERIGFKVLAYDRDDSPNARAMGRELGWDEQLTAAQNLFATYSLMVKVSD